MAGTWEGSRDKETETDQTLKLYQTVHGAGSQAGNQTREPLQQTQQFFQQEESFLDAELHHL